MEARIANYYGKPVYHLTAGSIELDCLAEAGPRIVRLSYQGSPNLLAEVPQITTSTPFGDYHYMGGHRLWHAPESMPRSYIPDEDGLSIYELEDGIGLDGKTESATGIHKQIEIHIQPERPIITLKHTLSNESLWAVELSPWAITMLKLGGTAILPMLHPLNQNPLLPNRHIALWNYSHINDPRLTLTDNYIFIKALAGLPPFKIGTFDQPGWIGYWNNGVFFRKRFAVFPEQLHPDHNSNAEIYCDEHFIELESIAPLSKISPGNSVTHIENWEFTDQLSKEFLPLIQR